jgi:hypothetical protein
MPDLNFYHQTESMNDYDLAMQEEGLNIQRAEANGDTLAARTASQNLAALRVQRSEYVAMSNQHAASLRPAPGSNRYGLSAEEVEVAKASHSAGTPEERIEEYARNKQRYQQARRDGSYRDDQGTVRR